MAIEDVIKSYVMALGVQVDNPSVNKAKAVLRDMDNEVQKRTSGMAANAVKASTIIITSLVSIGAATVDLINKVAQADLGYEKFALRMYMAKDVAKDFKIVTDAMGESLQDIAWIPELNQRYQMLMKEAKGMELPGGAGNQLQYIRDIRFEFTRLKVEATYGLQWIGYYMFKYLMDPITGTKFGLKDINDWIQRKMPEWADKIARFLVTIWNLATATFRALKDMGGALKTIWDSMPSWLKSLIAIGAAIAIAITAPVTTALAAITSLVLMIEDFYAYIDGRKSNPQLAPIWDKLIDYAYRLNRYWAGTVIFIEEFNRSISKFGWSGIVGDKKRKAIEQKEFGGDMVERSRKRMAEWEEANPRWTKDNVPIRRGTNGPVEEAAARLSRVESGAAGYYARGQWIPSKQDFAYGKYQIMTKNWPSWSRDAGLGPNAKWTAENQDAVFRDRWSKYYRKYGSSQLADVAWYAGEGAADKLAKGDKSVLRYRPESGVAGPDVEGYLKKAHGDKYEGYKGRYLGQWQGEFVPSQQAPSQSSQIINNIPITIQSGSAEETARQVENVIKKYQGQQNVMDIRYPSVSGVAP